MNEQEKPKKKITGARTVSIKQEIETHNQG